MGSHTHYFKHYYFRPKGRLRKIANLYIEEKKRKNLDIDTENMIRFFKENVEIKKIKM